MCTMYIIMYIYIYKYTHVAYIFKKLYLYIKYLGYIYIYYKSYMNVNTYILYM